MTELDIVSIFDPELIIPSRDSVGSIEFWYRLQQWVDDPRPRLGRLTLSALYDLISSPPTVRGLPLAEFLSIVSPLVARGLDVTKATNSKWICSSFARDYYAPYLGDEANSDRLFTDIGSVQDHAGMALATDQRCWTAGYEGKLCEDCELVHPLLLLEPNGDISTAWRTAFIALKGADIGGLREFADRMFPNLVFHENSWSDVGSLSRSAQEIVDSLIHHLGVLNDCAPAIWSQNVSASDRKARLGSKGVSASLENARTHSSRKAMKARQFGFDGVDVLCEWHTKILRHRDRIYFEVEGGVVYIGAITRHL